MRGNKGIVESFGSVFVALRPSDTSGQPGS